MKTFFYVAVSAFHALGVLGAAESSAQNWPQFRGENAAGTSASAKPPIRISATEGVEWKVEVPWSPSSPVVWGDRIFLTTFANGELQTRAYACADGKLLWSKGVKPEQLEVFHRTDGSPSASTPATDGERVISYFGSFGLICHDPNGNELWRRPMELAFSGGGYGSGTSPIIAGKLVILNRDQDRDSSLLAVDLQTGKTVWETPRPDAVGSFGTPIIWNNEGVQEVVLAGSLRIKGYDLQTGRERWVVDGISGFVCTTPVVGAGMLFFAAWSPGASDAPWPAWATYLAQNDKNHDGAVELEELDAGSRDFSRGLDRDHDGKISQEDWEILVAGARKAKNVVLAVKAGGLGNISATHVAWQFSRGLPYVPSPLFLDDRLYLVKDGGMFSSLDAATGKPFYTQERLGAIGSYYASPVAADGRIYLASLPGKVTVLKAGGNKPEILHQADFGERIFATPALAGEHIYLRTEHHLWALK
jgi:outer membrane protein assembly factor BamB